MNIQLDYAAPSAAMADYVTLFYWFRADVPMFEDVERADHAQIRFRLTPGGGEYRFVDDTVKAVGDAHIIGPTTGAYHVRAPGPVHVFGAGLSAAGWAGLVGIASSALVNRTVDLADLFGAAAAADAIERLIAAPDLAAKTACCETILGRLLSAQRPQILDFVRKVDAWLSTGPSPDVDDLTAAIGLSRRQVERKCRALYGAPPKLLARKYRALRAAVLLVANNARMDDVAGYGFYDQSHMIREIKHFTGFTPGKMKTDPGILSQLTIEHRVAMGGKVHPLISET